MKSTWLLIAVTSVLFFSWSSIVDAQNKRDEKVRGDRESLKDDDSWYYDDLDSGLKAASTGKQPLMVVLRCIP